LSEQQGRVLVAGSRNPQGATITSLLSHFQASLLVGAGLFFELSQDELLLKKKQGWIIIK
jgi:hypothetical protein